MFYFFRKVLIKVKSVVIPRSKNRYSYLSAFSSQLKARNIMEIGTNKGRSALLMIQAAQASANSPGEVSYYGFDLFELLDDSTYEKEVAKRSAPLVEVEDSLKQTGANIYLYKGFTKDTLPHSISNLPAMDLIFIDGGHTKETISFDWEQCQTLMHDKTVVIFDDFWSDGFNGNFEVGCNKVVEAIDRKNYSVEILARQDVIPKEWGKLRINLVKVTKIP